MGNSDPSEASNAVTPVFLATTYTLTGPDSGNAFTTSSDFMITPNYPYTGTITITPSGSASFGLSPVTKTFSNSADPQTFTFFPTRAGTLTLTATNNHSLANPTLKNYTVNATVPGVPTNPIATVGNRQASIAFTPPVNTGGITITQYAVISTPENITVTGSSSPIVVPGLTNGTEYTFQVMATNAQGTGLSSTASNSVIPQGTPATTYAIEGSSEGSINTSSEFTITPNGEYTGTITITPSGSASAGLSPVTKTFFYDQTPQKFTITPTQTGTISLVGTNNHSLADPDSKMYTVTPVSASAPRNLQATRENAQVILSWDAPADNGGSNITDYRVEYKRHTDSDWTLFAHTASTDTTETVTFLTNGTFYDFRVSAVTQTGTGSPSSVTSAIPATVPDVPASLSATAGNAQVTVSFTVPTNDGGFAITGYTVTSNPGSVTATGSTSPITVTGLANGTSYTFTIHATNAVGNSGESDLTNEVTPLETIVNPEPTPEPEPNPIHESVQEKDSSDNEKCSTPDAPKVIKTQVTSATSIRLFFTVDRKNIDSFRIKYGTAKNTYTEKQLHIKDNARFADIIGLLPDTTYFFRIRADHDCENSKWSKEVFATTKKRRGGEGEIKANEQNNQEDQIGIQEEDANNQENNNREDNNQESDNQESRNTDQNTSEAPTSSEPRGFWATLWWWVWGRW